MLEVGPFDVEGWGVLEVVGSLVVADPLHKKRGRGLIPLDLLAGLGSFSLTASCGDRILFLLLPLKTSLSLPLSLSPDSITKLPPGMESGPFYGHKCLLAGIQPPSLFSNVAPPSWSQKAITHFKNAVDPVFHISLSILCTLSRCCPIFWTGPEAQSTTGHQK